MCLITFKLVFFNDNNQKKIEENSDQALLKCCFLMQDHQLNFINID